MNTENVFEYVRTTARIQQWLNALNAQPRISFSTATLDNVSTLLREQQLAWGALTPEEQDVLNLAKYGVSRLRPF